LLVTVKSGVMERTDDVGSWVRVGGKTNTVLLRYGSTGCTVLEYRILLTARYDTLLTRSEANSVVLGGILELNSETP